jgi:hypothetical protein
MERIKGILEPSSLISEFDMFTTHESVSELCEQAFCSASSQQIRLNNKKRPNRAEKVEGKSMKAFVLLTGFDMARSASQSMMTERRKDSLLQRSLD